MKLRISGSQEGKALEADICDNVENIKQLLKEIEPFEKQRIEALKLRLKRKSGNLKINGNVDENRFEQELIFYLEKLDINEEKVRLANHCEYFLKLSKKSFRRVKNLDLFHRKLVVK